MSDPLWSSFWSVTACVLNGSNAFSESTLSDTDVAEIKVPKKIILNPDSRSLGTERVIVLEDGTELRTRCTSDTLDVLYDAQDAVYLRLKDKEE